VGQWKDERDTILAEADLDPKVRKDLECVSLADPTFFDIPRLRPYFKWDRTSYQQRLHVTYVTALSNCKTPIQAARIHGSIIKHLQEKLKSASLYAAFQDIISDPGHIDATSVNFEIALAFQWGSQMYAPAHYKPDPAASARRWRGIYGDLDPYRDQTFVAAHAVITTDVNNATAAATAATTASEEPLAKIDVPKEGGDRPAYLAQLRDALRTNLGTQEDATVAGSADANTRAAFDTLCATGSMPTDTTLSTVEQGMRISELLKTSLNRQETVRHLKSLAECNDGDSCPADHAPCLLGAYGSLRSGMHNHFCLDSDDLLFLGRGTARGVLFPVGNAVPGAHFSVDRPDTDKVTLEVYLLPFSSLKKLDKLLGFTRDATSLYTRRTVLATMESGELLLTHVYEYDGRASREPIPSGDWFEYRKSRE